MPQQPNPLQPLIDAVNASTLKTQVSIDQQTEKILKATIYTLAASLVISAIINRSKR